MGDLVPECRKKMARFRLQELRDVLIHLGVPKTGRKQELTERILALLSDEGASGTHGPQKNRSIRKDDVAKIINETYRKMSHIGPNGPVTGGRSIPDSSSTATKEETVDQKMRCPCGSPLETEFMIQCADSHCHVLQHISCVIIPLESTEGAPPAHSQHYCEVCRIDRCDPFWKTLAHPLYPVKLLLTSTPDDGQQIQTVETGFQITKANVHLLENSGYDVQAWCILLNDNVPFRMQWPQYPDLRVNGIPVKTINRPGSKMLGANGRDDAPSIAVFLVEGHNNIYLSCADARKFCVGVRLVKQRTVQQVISMIPGEQEGESFTEAVSRVCRCIGGGMAATNDDSDSDLEVIADNVTINLRCPMSGCRMKTAARFKGCIHLGCFDLHTLVEINQRSRKWQCPICLKNYSLEDIIIDPYLNRIVKMMQACDEDVTEIEVKSDCSWRVKIARPFKDLEKWHLSDGSLCAEANDDSNMEVSAVKSENQLENGNMNGHSDGRGNHIEEYSTNHAQEIISMSSGSSDDMQEDEFESVDRPCLMDFTPYNHNQTSGITNRSSSSSLADPGIIVLSDSEEENLDTVYASEVAVPSPPNGCLSSLTANLETSDIHLRDAAAPDASSRPSGESESSEMSNNKQPGDPFTFPRQPRTVRRQHATKDAPAIKSLLAGGPPFE